MRERARKGYLLGILLLVLAFNSVDRLALGLVLQDIKVDLDLTDTQLGLLTGIAFALFYSVMGLPLARHADRGNRVRIIAITTALCGAAVALCGAVTSFAQLLLVRVGVAIGEAGCNPAANSMIASAFSRAERPRATAVFLLGVPLSAVFGYLLAGWLNEAYGWRAMFVLLGLPSLMVAALAGLTLREPRSLTRETGIPNTAAPSDPQSLREVCTILWASATFRHLAFCFAVKAFFTYGIVKWQPTFFIRSFGLETGELGSWLAAIYGVGGLLGTYLGGEWASRHAAHDEPRQLKAMAIAFSAFGLISSLVYLSSNRHVALGLLAVGAIGVSMVTAPLFATIQTVVPERMRATAVAIIYLFANLIGMGLGPLVAGALSDAFRAWAGEESLRYALLVLCPGYFWVGWHLWRASGTVSSELR